MGQTLEQLAEDLARIADEREIESVIYRYGQVIDFGTPQDYAGLFTEDGEVEVRSAFAEVLGLEAGIAKPLMDLLIERGAEPTEGGMIFRGQAALRGFVTRPPRTARSLHVSSQPRVQMLDRDAAEAMSYLRIYRHAPGEAPQVVGFGRYLDRFERTPVGWRIRRRVIEM